MVQKEYFLFIIATPLQKSGFSNLKESFSHSEGTDKGENDSIQIGYDTKHLYDINKMDETNSQNMSDSPEDNNSRLQNRTNKSQNRQKKFLNTKQKNDISKNKSTLTERTKYTNICNPKTYNYPKK